MMTSSDIITITAIVVSAIISIMSIYISFVTNKQNISAKRKEIALEKQLEAFSTLQNAVQEIAKLILSLDEKPNQSIDQNFLKKLKIAHDIFIQKHDLLRIYIPKKFDSALEKISIPTYKLLAPNGETDEETNNYLREIILAQDKFVTLIREYIGIEPSK
jgi:hypothetical protein